MIDWLAAVFFIIPAYFFQTFIHEGSHAFVVNYLGGDVTVFKIWPHRTKTGRFFWGRVGFDVSSLSLMNKERSWIYLSPFIANPIAYAFWLLWIVLWALFEDKIMTTFGLVFFTATAVDWTRGYLNRYIGKGYHDINRYILYAEPNAFVRHWLPGIAALHVSAFTILVWVLVLTRG